MRFQGKCREATMKDCCADQCLYTTILVFSPRSDQRGEISEFNDENDQEKSV